MRDLLSLFGAVKSGIEWYRYRRHIRDLLGRGLTIGRNVTIMPSVWIDYEYCYLVAIGDNCSLSKGVKILAHDATMFKFTDGYTKIGKVTIRDNCFFGENSIVLPGVTIGPDVLVAAGSVVNKSIPPNSCVAGNPARFYARFDDYIGNQRKTILTARKVGYADIERDKTLRRKLKEAGEPDQLYVQGFVGKFPWIWNVD